MHKVDPWEPGREAQGTQRRDSDAPLSPLEILSALDAARILTGGNHVNGQY